jgi:hypothetical protein
MGRMTSHIFWEKNMSQTTNQIIWSMMICAGNHQQLRYGTAGYRWGKVVQNPLGLRAAKSWDTQNSQQLHA